MSNGLYGPPTTVGKVNHVKVAMEHGWLGLESGEMFLLWTGGEDPSPSDRVRHSMWVSLLEHAVVHGLQVEIGHKAEYSCKVVHVKLLAS